MKRPHSNCRNGKLYGVRVCVVQGFYYPGGRSTVGGVLWLQLPPPPK